MTYYKVSFQYSESVYCSNIAHAENEEAVKEHYSKYEWFSVSPATEADVETAKKKGMPIIEIETKKEEKTMYENITKLIEKETEESKETRRRYICDEENTGSLERNSTALRWGQFKRGEIDRETANGYALKRAYKEVEKWEAEKKAKLQRAENAAAVVSVSISIEWRRSRTWGANPTAEVTVEDANGHYYRGTGTASGCGYDKESAAVASALNGSNSIIKMLCDCKESALDRMEATGKTNESNRDFIAYGAGYGAVPYFEGGVGMSSHERVFNACGLVLKNQSHGKMYDTYYFEKKEA